MNFGMHDLLVMEYMADDNIESQSKAVMGVALMKYFGADSSSLSNSFAGVPDNTDDPGALKRALLVVPAEDNRRYILKSSSLVEVCHITKVEVTKVRRLSYHERHYISKVRGSEFERAKQQKVREDTIKGMVLGGIPWLIGICYMLGWVCWFVPYELWYFIANTGMFGVIDTIFVRSDYLREVVVVMRAVLFAFTYRVSIYLASLAIVGRESDNTVFRASFFLFLGIIVSTCIACKFR